MRRQLLVGCCCSLSNLIRLEKVRITVTTTAIGSCSSRSCRSFHVERGGGGASVGDVAGDADPATATTTTVPNVVEEQQQQQQQQQPAPVVVVLQELVRRLDEPKPLRSSSATGRLIHRFDDDTPSENNRLVAGIYLADEVERRHNNKHPTMSQAQHVTDYTSDMSLHDLAMNLCRNYRKLPYPSSGWTVPSARRDVLEFLALECSTHRDQVVAAMEHYQKQMEENDVMTSTKLSTTTTTTAASTVSIRSSPRLQSQERLRKACTDRYEMIFSYLLQQNAQEAMQFILNVREDLFQWTRSHESIQQQPQPHHARLTLRLKRLDNYIRQLLITWFNPGLIETRRITFEQTSAAVIEQIATKEAVHPLRSLEDLKLRLGSNRRVFCLFHPLLPNVPLVFVHVALSSDVPSSMDHVLQDSSLLAQDTNTTGGTQKRVAAFYSISNAQAGLAGVGLGEYLIKNAVKLLQAEFPNLDTFCTLSPIPRFRRWMTERVALSQRSSLTGEPLLSTKDAHVVAQTLNCCPNTAPQHLLDELEKNGPRAVSDPIHESLQPILLRLVARYICLEKHHGKPLDAVARFHIGNGAQVYRVNSLADVSRKGWHNSFGMMINYEYNLETIAAHQIQFEKDYRIPVCKNVMELLEGS